MAVVYTTLNGGITAAQLQVQVTDATGFIVGQPIEIESEFSKVASINGTTIGLTQRGDAGTSAVAHGSLSAVATAPAAEFPPVPQTVPTAAAQVRVTIPGDATVTIDPSLSGNTWVTYVLMKPTAAAITLVAPAKNQDGIKATFRSGTAAAHVVTYTAGFYGDTTGSDLATFAAKIGATATIEALNGTWGVLALGNVTVA